MKSNDLKMDFESLNRSLCDIYDQYGYTRYKMSKFEEYDLYAKNRDFWDSTGIITFSDRNGALMALKPDVTLSIVKNVRHTKGSISKLYYNENVYRTTRDSESFREITQAGLEALGDIDDYCIYEVLKLAAKSLENIGRRYMLEISDISLLCDFLEHIGVKGDDRDRALSLIGRKNLHELTDACRDFGLGEGDTELLKELISIHGTPTDNMDRLESILGGRTSPEALERFKEIVAALATDERRDSVVVDFSIVNDTKYYNGFVFKGYIEGIPQVVLSGGQYDILLQRMDKDCKALGFAVYMDTLESLFTSRREYDVDTLLIYPEEASLRDIEARVKEIAGDGRSIMVQRKIPGDTKYRELLYL